MDPTYAERYRDLARRHWWWRARNAWVRDQIRRLLDGRNDARTLDIGCGDGVLFPLLDRYGFVEGVEPDATVVSPDGPWRHRIHLQPFDRSFQSEGRYDLIVLLDVLEHLADPREALTHAHALLAPGGRIIVTLPAFHMLWTHHDDLNHHRERFTRQRLGDVASGAGLHLEASGYLFQWLFMAKLVERLRERVFGPAPAPTVPTAALNGLLYALSIVERKVLGLSMPFGSSLVGVLKARAT